MSYRSLLFSGEYGFALFHESRHALFFVFGRTCHPEQRRFEDRACLEIGVQTVVDGNFRHLDGEQSLLHDSAGHRFCCRHQFLRRGDFVDQPDAQRMLSLDTFAGEIPIKCANKDCDMYFVPSRNSQIYCSKKRGSIKHGLNQSTYRTWAQARFRAGLSYESIREEIKRRSP